MAWFRDIGSTGGGRARYARYIARPLILEESGPPNLVRGTILTLVGGILAFIVWAAISQLTESTHASGFVSPEGAVKPVQHLEGGIVQTIFKRDGDLVEQGETILRFDGSATLSGLREQEARLVGLELQAARLRAFADGRTPDFTEFPASYGGLVADQLTILRLQKDAREKKRKVSLLQISQRRSEHASLIEQRRSLDERIKITREVLSMRETLLASKLVSRITYLTTKQDLAAAVGERANVVKQIAGARQAIAEARGVLAQIDADLRNEAVSEMGRLTNEITAVRQSIQNLRDRAARLEVRARVRGIINAMSPSAPGAVIPPGGVIAEIVPDNAELVVDARVSPSDIGTLQSGQTASVRIQTFDFARYGSVEGTVDKLSATTFTAEDGTVYYKATVRLAQNHVGEDPTRNLILPGMTVDVGINTGQGSVLRYLLRPVYESLGNAFSEP